MNLGEWLDFINKTADDFQSKAEEDCERKKQRADYYCEGYKKCAEDFARVMRSKMREL